MDRAIDRVLGGVIGDLEAGMRFRTTRQAALAANVANADTPGYRRVEVTFEGALQRANELQRTDSSHGFGDQRDGVRVRLAPQNPQSPDGNGVERDRELVRLSRNAGAFQDQAEVLARIMIMRKIAATGQV